MKQQGNKIKVLGKDNALWAENQRLKAAIERVREFCNDAIDYGQYIIRAEDVLEALDGEQ